MALVMTANTSTGLVPSTMTLDTGELLPNVPLHFKKIASSQKMVSYSTMHAFWWVSGLQTYEKGKAALQSWRHFGLDWAFVDPKTPIQSGVKFCACVKEIFPWLMMPLQVVYVNENRNAKKAVASFGFGSGTLQGHLLAGEERFSIELDENNQVWYEILSFSKPAHFLSLIGYPYVHLRQKYLLINLQMLLRKFLDLSNPMYLNIMS